MSAESAGSSENANGTPELAPAFTGRYVPHNQACTTCGLRGHNAARCPLKQAVKCSVCRSPWHTAAKCPRRDREWRPAGEGSRRGQRLTAGDVTEMQRRAQRTQAEQQTDEAE